MFSSIFVAWLVQPPPTVSEVPTEQPADVAGAVLLPLGLVALGSVGGVASISRRNLAEADALHAELALRPRTSDDLTRMRDLLGSLRREQALMISLGLTGAALVATGTALLVRGTRPRRQPRLGLDLRRGHLGLTITGEF